MEEVANKPISSQYVDCLCSVLLSRYWRGLRSDSAGYIDGSKSEGVRRYLITEGCFDDEKKPVHFDDRGEFIHELRLESLFMCRRRFFSGVGVTHIGPYI